MTTEATPQPPSPEAAAFSEAMQAMAQAVANQLHADKHFNVTEFAVQMNGMLIQTATLVDMLVERGVIDRSTWIIELTRRATAFTAEMNRPRIQIAAPRGRQ